jgi:signal transduction histidine kinase
VRDLEAFIRRKDGEIRTLLVSGEVLEVGGQNYTLSVAADITERKQAEEMLSIMSRRLIEAQEEERAWIARELHDDFNQRVAMVSVNLECLERDLSGSEVQAKSYTEEIKEQINELGRDLQALSHRLHSSKLDYLGLESACKGFCTELSARPNVEIEFHSENIPPKLPKETSLCLFRVLQEALQNAVKHSGVRSFRVSLDATSDEVKLSVSDSGSGFDFNQAISGQGLGLTSMKERLKLVDGQLSIDSKPGQGTTIHARVPLSPVTVARSMNV